MTLVLLSKKIQGMKFTLTDKESKDYDTTFFVNFTEEQAAHGYGMHPFTIFSCSLKFVHKDIGMVF